MRAIQASSFINSAAIHIRKNRKLYLAIIFAVLLINLVLFINIISQTMADYFEKAKSVLLR